MNLLFIRHGQSENNAIWADNRSREGRVPDPIITGIGTQQMVYTAQFLESYLAGELNQNPGVGSVPAFDRFYLFCSLMERSIQSGEIISQRLNIPLLGHMDIHENGGLYDHDPVTDEPKGMPGLSKNELNKKYPGLVLPEGMNSSGWWNRGYENRDLSELRAGRVVSELRNKYASDNSCLVFISHGGFYNTFIHQLLGSANGDAWFELFNGALTLLEFGENGSVNFLYNNRFDFLPDDKIT